MCICVLYISDTNCILNCSKALQASCNKKKSSSWTRVLFLSHAWVSSSECIHAVVRTVSRKRNKKESIKKLTLPVCHAGWTHCFSSCVHIFRTEELLLETPPVLFPIPTTIHSAVTCIVDTVLKGLLTCCSALKRVKRHIITPWYLQQWVWSS